MNQRSTMRLGHVLAGRYLVGDALGRGGMGSVWRAHDNSLDVAVAIKFMSSELAKSERLRARFKHEAKAAARIRSPHIVQILDHGLHDEQPYICMELLEGEDLGDRLRREKVMSLEDTVRICRDVCKGLHRAHDVGIVHRDLKPANIFLSRPDDNLAKILDFGIAKSTAAPISESEPTATDIILGSPHYMSPEQARGQPVDGRSDLWSLAVIAYRMLTGRRPFPGQQVGDVLVRICTDVVQLPSTIRPGLPTELDTFFMRALSRDPAGRYPTAREFGTAMTKAAGLQARSSLTPPVPFKAGGVRDSFDTLTPGPAPGEILETMPEGRKGRERTPPPVGLDKVERPRRLLFVGAAAAFFFGGLLAYGGMSRSGAPDVVNDALSAAIEEAAVADEPPTADEAVAEDESESESESESEDSPEPPPVATASASAAVSATPTPRRRPVRAAPKAPAAPSPEPLESVLGY